jgi:hypothetical protein
VLFPHTNLEGYPDRDMGWENQTVPRWSPAGAIPLGKFESRYGETDAFTSPELGSASEEVGAGRPAPTITSIR